MLTYRWVGGIAPHIHNNIRFRRMVRLTPRPLIEGEIMLLAIGQEVECPPPPKQSGCYGEETSLSLQGIESRSSNPQSSHYAWWTSATRSKGKRSLICFTSLGQLDSLCNEWDVVGTDEVENIWHNFAVASYEIPPFTRKDWMNLRRHGKSERRSLRQFRNNREKR